MTLLEFLGTTLGAGGLTQLANLGAARARAHAQRGTAEAQSRAVVAVAAARVDVADADATGKIALAVVEDAGDLRAEMLARMDALEQARERDRLEQARERDRQECRREINELIAKVTDAEARAAKAVVRADVAEGRAAALHAELADFRRALA